MALAAQFGAADVEPDEAEIRTVADGRYAGRQVAVDECAEEAFGIGGVECFGVVEPRAPALDSPIR